MSAGDSDGPAPVRGDAETRGPEEAGSERERTFVAEPGAESDLDLQRVHGSILREHNDPEEGRESVPLWLVTGMMLLVFWGGFYLAMNSGGFRADVFVPRQERGPAANATPLAPGELGRRVYVRNCVLCHQATGLGVGTQYPPLAGSEWVLTEPGGWQREHHLIAILLHGMEGPMRVRGRTYNGAMPPWKFLKDEEIAAVLTYIRSEWGNAAPPIEAADVAAVRAQTRERQRVWSAAELREWEMGQ